MCVAFCGDLWPQKPHFNISILRKGHIELQNWPKVLIFLNDNFASVTNISHCVNTILLVFWGTKPEFKSRLPTMGV